MTFANTLPRKLIAAATVSVAIAATLGGASSAHAESDITSAAAGAISASARLDFRITVPKIIFLQVGTGTAFSDVGTIDRVDMTLTNANVTSGGAVAAAAGVTARVLGNGGAVSLNANGTAGGLSNGSGQSIAWTQVTSATSNAGLPHPVIGNGAIGATSTLPATLGVVNQTATWTFGFSNSLGTIAAGTYNGQVVYTAALP